MVTKTIKKQPIIKKDTRPTQNNKNQKELASILHRNMYEQKKIDSIMRNINEGNKIASILRNIYVKKLRLLTILENNRQIYPHEIIKLNNLRFRFNLILQNEVNRVKNLDVIGREMFFINQYQENSILIQRIFTIKMSMMARMRARMYQSRTFNFSPMMRSRRLSRG